MNYDEQRGYYYLENFSALPWIAENNPKKIVGNVDAAQNPLMNFAYKQYNDNGSIVMAGGTFYCSYIGSYAKTNSEQNEQQNKTNCLKRFGYTGDYLSIATLCDPIEEEDTTPSDVEPWWSFLASEYNVGLGFSRVEPYQETIKQGNYAPFPPIWGRITYTNQARGCLSELKKWVSGNLNLLPYDDILNMINSFRGGQTGPYWWKNYFSKYKQNKTLFNTKISETLDKQLGTLGNSPWITYKKSVYGNPMGCSPPGSENISTLPGKCACHSRYFGCTETIYSVLSCLNVTFDEVPGYILYDPYTMVSDAYIYNAALKPLQGFEYGLLDGSSFSCYYSGWSIPEGGWNSESEESESNRIYEFSRIFSVGKGWNQINAVGTVLYSDEGDLENSNWNANLTDFLGCEGGAEGFTGKIQWSGGSCNFINPKEELMDLIREIYHSKPGDQGTFKRGILGRNLRYNMSTFPTANVFYEGLPFNNGEAWKDSSFTKYHKNICNQPSPGSMTIVVPIYGTRNSSCRDCDADCLWGNEQNCQLTLGNNTGDGSCWPGWAQLLTAEDMNCFPYDPNECGCENRTYIGPGEDTSRFERGRCLWDSASTGANVSVCDFWQTGNGSFSCCPPVNGVNGCIVADPCTDVPGNGGNFVGGGAVCYRDEFSLHYPKRTNLAESCVLGLTTTENTKRVTLEDGSCVEMLCPECNNYPPCGS
jgi:hypothetical protein